MSNTNKTETLWDLYRPPLAEFIATTLFVWVGCGAAVSGQAFPLFYPNSPAANTFLVTVSLAFGLAISVLVYTIAPISGGHINPAVTFAFVVTGNMPVNTGIRYVLAQCLGALLGASMVWGSDASDLLTNDGEKPPFNVGMNKVNPNVPVGSAFLGECMGTFLLVWTVLMTAVSAKSIAGNTAPIAIGWAVALAHFVLIPLTGCGINPARSLGPMLVVIMAGGKAGLTGWWIYYTAPFVGSGFAALVCKYVFEAFKEDSKAFEEVIAEHEKNMVVGKKAPDGDDDDEAEAQKERGA